MVVGIQIVDFRQNPVGRINRCAILYHHTSQLIVVGCRNIDDVLRIIDTLIRCSADEKHYGKDKLCSERQGVDIVDTDITLDLESERLAYRLAAHMHIVVKTALLNDVIFKLL